MSQCKDYNADDAFERFEVIEFPISYVGLATTKTFDVGVNLDNSAYIKTSYQGKLLKFDEAREISPSHRAFHIKMINNHCIEVTFTPTNECISKARREHFYDNRFVFDLRLIKVDGTRCCYDEAHSEIGRYYISGQFEYCQIVHFPDVLDFGDVIINTEVSTTLQIRNNSNNSLAKMRYVKVTGYKVIPSTITILPNSSKEITIRVKPTSLKLKNSINFTIINPHDSFERQDENSTNLSDNLFIIYSINIKTNIIYAPIRGEIEIESMHKLHELNSQYTYKGEEILVFRKRKNMALTYLQNTKSKPINNSLGRRNNENQTLCYSDLTSLPKHLFCENDTKIISIYDVLEIQLDPLCLNFGKVATETYGKSSLTIYNNSEYIVNLAFLMDDYITYTDKKIPTKNIELKAFSKTSMTVYCFGMKEGINKNSFEFIIQHQYHQRHPYSLEVSNPTLSIFDNSIKFGMVTPEAFVVSVPLRIYNYFNTPIDFEWKEISPDTPFDIIPKNGKVLQENCTICDIFYLSKAIKTKTHELYLESKFGETINTVTIETTLMTRKLSIKFLQQSVIFKDVPLNLETIEKIRMENSSREIALFHVVEQLIPGIRVEPMNGIIGPKMIITFDIIVKIPYPLEFSFDIFVKINNKENVILPVSGNIVDPKIIIHPKNVNMTRVPSYMITYVPIIFQNVSTLKCMVEVLDGDDDMFRVYSTHGNEYFELKKFVISGGQSKTIYVKVYDDYRREYEMYMPFQINGMLGPPNSDPSSIETRYYINNFEKFYENNPKVKIKAPNKDISFCRMSGVITVPWIIFSEEKFEIYFIPGQKDKNTIKFTMTNVSKYYLYITILTSKLTPNFTLKLHTFEGETFVNENQIKFELDRQKEAELSVVFHPKENGKFTSVALLYLDKHMTVPYSNLTFLGIKDVPKIIPSIYRILFPPCYVGEEVNRVLVLTSECESNADAFSCVLIEESSCTVNFMNSNSSQEDIRLNTIVSAEIIVNSNVPISRNEIITFHHICGSFCEVEIYYCFTYCPITLHINHLTNSTENPYPYYPRSTQCELYEYMEKCTNFLEKWMFQQGFHRDLYPKIPDTFLTISNALSSQPGKTKPKGINVTYLSFVRRIAGPLMKHIRKIKIYNVEESFKWVKEIHDTYKEIMSLLKSRGANLWMLQAKYLLSYEQFVIYNENITPKLDADVILTQQLIEDIELFDRLNKQSWIDFILQSYKVFVMDSCFFDCVCVSSQPRDIVKILIDWYNDNNLLQSLKLQKKSERKVISNITTDLSDGIVIIMTILNYCPFMEEHFSSVCDIDGDLTQECTITNACLIIEAMNILKLYFPLITKDFLEPTFLQMLFLSTHLYVTLPMFKPKEVIYFNPPILKSSSRQISINSTNQESLTYNFIVMNNIKNNFTVEKVTTDNGKKMCLNIKYLANFVEEITSTLLVYGYNKTRIFDTFIVFSLCGCVGALNPLRKCKVSGPLYRANKVDVLISSPFSASGTYSLEITDDEPSIPVKFKGLNKPNFYIQRLNLIDREIFLSGIPKESGQEVQEHKLYLYIICLSTLVSNSWVWFRSDIGEFFIKISTQPRWDSAIDTLVIKTSIWPLNPCSCGEDCECYRTTVVMIPHCNELMLKSLRIALSENASEVMLHVFDKLIKTITGKIILMMLLEETGTNISELRHIMQSKTNYRITSRTLVPRINRVTMDQHSENFLTLPITLPAHDKTEKFSITLTSDCGMDIRMYKIIFTENSENSSI